MDGFFSNTLLVSIGILFMIGAYNLYIAAYDEKGFPKMYATPYFWIAFLSQGIAHILIHTALNHL